MNWDAISAIGELVGAGVVFMTLGYLAVQVRQARGEVLRTIAHARAETVRDLLMTRATDERLGALYVQATTAIVGTPPAFISALMERTGLTVAEAAALYWEQLAWWQYRLEVIPYVDDLPVAQRTEFESGIRQNYGSQPVERLFYETAKTTFPPAAVSYIDDLLARQSLE